MDSYIEQKQLVDWFCYLCQMPCDSLQVSMTSQEPCVELVIPPLPPEVQDDSLHFTNSRIWLEAAGFLFGDVCFSLIKLYSLSNEM